MTSKKARTHAAETAKITDTNMSYVHKPSTSDYWALGYFCMFTLSSRREAGTENIPAPGLGIQLSGGERLPSMHEALSHIPNTGKKGRTDTGGREGRAWKWLRG